MTLKLRPYQVESVDFLAGKRIALLAHEMRVGKTPCAIKAAEKIGAKRALVLCPAIAVPMWRSEWLRWWPASGQPTVMSYERALLRRAEILAETYDVAVVDESHFAGNPEAQRTRMIYGKDSLADRTKHLWALSGTPAPKHAGSLWPLLCRAGVTDLDYDQFVRRYCRIDWFSQRPVGTREERIPELRALWQSIGLRRTRKEVAPDMPDIGFDFLQVDLDKKVDLANPGPMSDEALLDRLESRANVDREDRIAVAMAKVKPLCEEIEFALSNALLKQTVVFGWHVEPLKKITSVLKAVGFRTEMLYGETPAGKRVEIQEQFSQGLIDVIVGQIRACGTSIDLSAASHAYFVELDWVPASNVQAVNRLVAIGKNEKITADVVTVPGSVDDRVQRVLLKRSRELSILFT